MAALRDNDLETAGLTLVGDPLPVPPEISPAHALFTGWATTPSRVRAQARTLADAAECVFPGKNWHESALEAEKS